MWNCVRTDGAIPLVETPRLLLRGHRLEDFEPCAAMWADSEVVRYTVGQPLTPEDVWARLLRYAGHWALLGFGYWAMEEKSTGKFIGELGFADLKREMLPSIDGMAELGWILSPSAHGKGYATEATRAAISWGENHFQARKMVCIIDPENTASLRVAEKCGFRETLRTTYKGMPTILFER
jgi:RimJ/RimL family protein N-acetyltransferase